MIPANIDRQLLKVQKPARYCGGEMGSIQKDREEVDLRFAFWTSMRWGCPTWG